PNLIYLWFIVALSFAYFSKALTGTYMKSSITQIERRFDLSSTHIGLIDGSFEMGNLLFLAVVSHFGAKLHRPRLIAMGCFLMGMGAFLTGLTHFFMGSYKYDTVIQVFQNDSVNIAAWCVFVGGPDAACVKDSGSNMWIYVFLGNALRGIGETPVTPLGISYIDDFAKAENSPFYIACLQTITLLGPMFGFLLGSYCAKLYVDVGYVDMETVTITPKDARWVGAWWMGFLVSSALLLISSIPFWFLPRSLPKQGADEDQPAPAGERQDGTDDVSKNNFKFTEIAKGFLPSLKRLLGTPAYFLLLCGSILKFNSFIGLFTFKAKYMEQQFGQSASRANFLIGMKKCNRDCSCSAEEWDPVCSDSGITYISPCMAGCLSSSGFGKNTVFHNCSCVSASYPAGSSTSVKLGQCPHAKDCSRSFTSYMAVSVLSSFINSLGATPGYMVIIRCISPELKSLALGIQALVTRTLGGIPAPVYFGALIDSTCLKWSIKKCGGRGACRIYDSEMYRFIFLGLITCLSGSSYFFIIAVIILLRKQFRKSERETAPQQPNASKNIELKAPVGLVKSNAPKVWVRTKTELKESTEVHKTEQFGNDGKLITNKTQVKQQFDSLTMISVELSPPPADGGTLELDSLMPEEEEKEQEKEEEKETEKEVEKEEEEKRKDEVCQEKDTQVEKEKLDHHTDDKKESEKETPHSRESADQQK
uniref:Solute carrier organic anion transporter family member n=1 Tax=Echeneis naucrates TaxID=173247 RepID=A0A665X7P0_ECHNA